MYRQTVLPLKRDKYTKVKKSLLDMVLGDDTLYASFNDAYFICKTCDIALSKGNMPLQSLANNLQLSSVPPELSCLNGLEIRLISLRVAFMKFIGPAFWQAKVHTWSSCQYTH